MSTELHTSQKSLEDNQLLKDTCLPQIIRLSAKERTENTDTPLRSRLLLESATSFCNYVGQLSALVRDAGEKIDRTVMHFASQSANRITGDIEF